MEFTILLKNFQKINNSYLHRNLNTPVYERDVPKRKRPFIASGQKKLFLKGHNQSMLFEQEMICVMILI